MNQLPERNWLNFNISGVSKSYLTRQLNVISKFRFSPPAYLRRRTMTFSCVSKFRFSPSLSFCHFRLFQHPSFSINYHDSHCFQNFQCISVLKYFLPHNNNYSFVSQMDYIIYQKVLNVVACFVFSSMGQRILKWQEHTLPQGIKEREHSFREKPFYLPITRSQTISDSLFFFSFLLGSRLSFLKCNK